MPNLRFTASTILCIVAAACTPAPETDQPADAAPAAPAEAAAQSPASPRDTARGTVGGATLLVDYGRPSRRGREVFGALVPFDEVWRTGANSATTLVVGDDINLGGRPLDAGTYTLYSVPARTGWTLIVNGQTGQWGTEYTEAEDVFRVPMTVSRAPAEVDTFKVSIAGGADAGQIVFAWDTLQGSVAVRAR